MPNKPLFVDSKEQALIDRVLDVFLSKGIKSITMDDVAVLLHVSKKTLYKYVKNRPELVFKAANLQIIKDKENINAIVAKNLNAIDENKEIAEYTIKTLAKMNPQVHYDMYHYFPKAAQVFEDYKTQFLYEVLVTNIQKGKKEGLYCSESNEKVLAKMYINKIDMVFDGRLFPPGQFNFPDVFFTFIMHHMRGMGTSKGIEIIDKMIDKNCK